VMAVEQLYTKVFRWALKNAPHLILQNICKYLS
jgi:hypothetical protein